MKPKQELTPKTNGAAGTVHSLHERLEAERRRLYDRLDSGRGGAPAPVREFSPGDDAVDELARDVACHEHEALVLRLQKVDAAIERLGQGSHGTCQECDGAIEPRRLDHDPAVMLCRDCQSTVEPTGRMPTL